MTTLNDVRGHLKDILAELDNMKTGQRNEDQRRLAILCTKIEDALSWSEYTWGTWEDEEETEED
jgi:hypothetical protein